MSKPRYINPDSREARINKRRQKILSDRGYNVAINGSWGPWQQKIWNLTIAQDPTITKRVNISKITQQENRGRAVPVKALEQFQDSLIGRSYPYPQRLAILATSLQEVDHRGAASVGKGGNGLLGLSKERMPVTLLQDTPEGRGDQIQFLLNDLEHIVGAPNNNWTSGNNQPPKVQSARDGFNKFWNASTPYDATIYLNKSYIRPAGNKDAWVNRADISTLLQQK